MFCLIVCVCLLIYLSVCLLVKCVFVGLLVCLFVRFDSQNLSFLCVCVCLVVLCVCCMVVRSESPAYFDQLKLQRTSCVIFDVSVLLCCVVLCCVEICCVVLCLNNVCVWFLMSSEQNCVLCVFCH